MPEIRVHLDDTLDKRIRLFKEQHDHKSKEKAIISLLEKYLE